MKREQITFLIFASIIFLNCLIIVEPALTSEKETSIIAMEDATIDAYNPTSNYGGDQSLEVFDLMQMESLINLDWFYDKLVENNVVDRPKFLIGTKLDLIEEQGNPFRIDDSFIHDLLERCSLNDFIKTSSKDNVNIQDIFKQMAKKILDFHGLEYEEIF